MTPLNSNFVEEGTICENRTPVSNRKLHDPIKGTHLRFWEL